VVLAAVAWAITSDAGATPQTVDPVRLDNGAKVYGSLCTTCHGPEGDVVGGVNLRTGQFRRAVTDADLMDVIVRGVPGTAMSGNKLGNADLLAVVTYIRNMKDYGARAVTAGDSERGRVIFEGKGGCLACHRVGQTGSHLGPNLSEIGAARSAASLQDTLLNPASTFRPANRTIRAVKKDGTVVTGRRLNEDTWSVQIVDSRERLVSLWKPDLTEYAVLESPMPSYRDTLTVEERSDLIGYLLSLQPGRGVPR
jgi:cytochrome c oxidase cbb3-type subunit III